MHRLGTITFVGVVLMVSVCTASLFYSHLPVHEETYVRHVGSRTRRDIKFPEDSPFPMYRSFMLTLDGKKVRIDLKLNRNQKDHVRVKTYNNGQFTDYSDSSPRDYAFYQQIRPESRAAVMVRCMNRQSTSCYIVGHIRVDGKDYKIEPKTNKATLVSKVKHVIYRADDNQKDLDYSGDTKTFTIDDSALVSGKNLEHNIRRKRQAGPTNFKIELELIIDYHIYSFWLQREGNVVNGAIDKIKEYYEMFVNDMDTRYTTATTSSMTIDIIPLEIIIIQDPTGNPWITNSGVSNGWIDASKALDKFQDWAESATGLANYDAIMAVTRKDLASYDSSSQQYRNGTAGLAYRFSRTVNGVSRPLALPCRQLTISTNNPLEKYAVSIIEDLSGGDGAHTGSHELAHNLGVSHDSTATGCTFEDQYIMASGRYRSYLGQVDAGRQWTFSSCSVNTMASSLQDLLTDGETCLQDNSYNTADYERIQDLPKSGESYTIDKQCQLLVDDASYFCSSLTSNISSVCHIGVYCYLPWTSNTCRNMFVMDGTDCSKPGENKVCQQGYCEDKSTATSAPSTQAPTTTTKTTAAPTTSTTTAAPTTTTTTAAPTTSTTTAASTTTTTTAAPTTSSTTAAPTTSTTTTTSAAPSTTTKTPAPTTTTSTTTTTPTTTTTTTSTAAPSTTTTTSSATAAPNYPCDVYCQVCMYLYQNYNGYIWYYCPSWLKAALRNQG